MGQAWGQQVPRPLRRPMRMIQRLPRRLRPTPRGQQQIPKVMILGLKGAGKTTILYRLQNKDVPPLKKLRTGNEAIIKRGQYDKVTLMEADVPSIGEFAHADQKWMEHLDQNWVEYLVHCQGVIWVVDSNDEENIAHSAEFLKYAMDYVQDPSVPLLVLANKVDLVPDVNVTDVGKGLNLELYKYRTHDIHPCCATTGVGLQDGLAWLLYHLAVIPDH